MTSSGPVAVAMIESEQERAFSHNHKCPSGCTDNPFHRVGYAFSVFIHGYKKEKDATAIVMRSKDKQTEVTVYMILSFRQDRSATESHDVIIVEGYPTTDVTESLVIDRPFDHYIEDTYSQFNLIAECRAQYKANREAGLFKSGERCKHTVSDEKYLKEYFSAQLAPLPTEATEKVWIDDVKAAACKFLNGPF